jgi:hypothetical protein
MNGKMKRDGKHEIGTGREEENCPGGITPNT